MRQHPNPSEGEPLGGPEAAVPTCSAPAGLAHVLLGPRGQSCGRGMRVGSWPVTLVPGTPGSPGNRPGVSSPTTVSSGAASHPAGWGQSPGPSSVREAVSRTALAVWVGVRAGPGRVFVTGREPRVRAAGTWRGWGPGCGLEPLPCVLFMPETGPRAARRDRWRHWGLGGARSPGCLPRRAPCASARVRGVRDGLGRPQELLAERQGRQGPRSVCGRLRQAAVLGLVWLLCLGTTVGCTVAVYAFSELMIKVRAERGRTARGP